MMSLQSSHTQIIHKPPAITSARRLAERNEAMRRRCGAQSARCKLCRPKNPSNTTTHTKRRACPTNTLTRCTDHSRTRNTIEPQLSSTYTIQHPRRCCVDAGARCSRGTPMLWCFTKRRAAAAAIVRARARAYFVDCSCRRVAGVRCEFELRVCVWCCYGTIIFYRYVCDAAVRHPAYLTHTRTNDSHIVACTQTTRPCCARTDAHVSASSRDFGDDGDDDDDGKHVCWCVKGVYHVLLHL